MSVRPLSQLFDIGKNFYSDKGVETKKYQNSIMAAKVMVPYVCTHQNSVTPHSLIVCYDEADIERLISGGEKPSDNGHIMTYEDEFILLTRPELKTRKSNGESYWESYFSCKIMLMRRPLIGWFYWFGKNIAFREVEAG